MLRQSKREREREREPAIELEKQRGIERYMDNTYR